MNIEVFFFLIEKFWFFVFLGYIRVIKVLEVFSVMRLNDGNFISILKRKFSLA